jgi:hypothetical protein
MKTLCSKASSHDFQISHIPANIYYKYHSFTTFQWVLGRGKKNRVKTWSIDSTHINEHIQEKTKQKDNLAIHTAFDFRIMDKLDGINGTIKLHHGEQIVQRKKGFG